MTDKRMKLNYVESIDRARLRLSTRPNHLRTRLHGFGVRHRQPSELALWWH